MSRALLPFLLLSQAGAGTVELLPRLYSDGVFRSAEKVPDAQVPRGSQGVKLLPGGYGGEWFLTLGGPKGTVSAHLSYLGTGIGLAQNVAPVAKLSGRVGATLASACFGTGTDRLSALRAWVEEKVRAGGQDDLNVERTFGPLRVQVLTQHTHASDMLPAGQAELDVILTRTGTPGSATRPDTCRL
ncbi:hypothetical protein [Deinococcus sp.]|uniref:hypothetical protein n=1 Tax=Deinococcus sp. TaxID=47478 RepID=UPI002869B4B0|nr:hypothetical protein [Deinococcus sp.]